MPGAVLLAPMAWRLPSFRLYRCPPVGEPQRRRAVTAGVNELYPFGVRDQMPRDAHMRDQFVMKRQLVVETEAVALVTDGVNARRHFDIAAWTLRRARRLPVRIVDRFGRVLGESVQNIGEQQFLVLLL